MDHIFACLSGGGFFAPFSMFYSTLFHHRLARVAVLATETSAAENWTGPINQEQKVSQDLHRTKPEKAEARSEEMEGEA